MGEVISDEVALLLNNSCLDRNKKSKRRLTIVFLLILFLLNKQFIKKLIFIYKILFKILSQNSLIILFKNSSFWFLTSKNI